MSDPRYLADSPTVTLPTHLIEELLAAAAEAAGTLRAGGARLDRQAANRVHAAALWVIIAIEP